MLDPRTSIPEGQYGRVYVIVASDINPEYVKKHGPEMFLLETRGSINDPWIAYDTLPGIVNPNAGAFKYQENAVLSHYKVVLPFALYSEYITNEYGEVFP